MGVPKHFIVLALAVLALGSCEYQLNHQHQSSVGLVNWLKSGNISPAVKQFLDNSLRKSSKAKIKDKESSKLNVDVQQLDKPEHGTSTGKSVTGQPLKMSSSKKKQPPKINPHVHFKNPSALKYEKRKYISSLAHGIETNSVAFDVRKAHVQKLKQRQLDQANHPMHNPDTKQPVEDLADVKDLWAKMAAKENMMHIKQYSEKSSSTRSKPKLNHPRIIKDTPEKEKSHTSSEYVDVHHTFTETGKFIKMKAHGRDFSFKLEAVPSISIRRKGFSEEAESAAQEKQKEKMLYIERETGAAFLLSKDSDEILQGRFQMDNADYHLKKGIKGKHIIKRNVVTGKQDRIVDGALKGIKSNGKIRTKRDTTGNSVYVTIEVLALVDSSIRDFHYEMADGDTDGDDHMHTYFAHMFNLINLRYANIQNSKLVISVSLAEIYIMMDDDSNSIFSKHHYEPDGIYGDLLLDDLSTYVQNEAYLSNEYNFDHVMAFTYRDLYDSESGSPGLLGIAYLGGVCDHDNGLASSVVEASRYNLEETVNVAAHELGHNLGADHDDSADCVADAGWIMGAYSTYPNKFFFYFSCCSQQAFFSTLMDGRECINMESFKNLVPSYLANGEAGQEYDTDYLCSLAKGEDYGACDLPFYSINDENLCEGLWCKPLQGSIDDCFPIDVIPYHGTKCGQDHWCMETKCVETFVNQTDLYRGPEKCELVKSNCEYYELECKSGTTKYSESTCYDKDWKCDEDEDCKDGSDQWSCGCPLSTFSCGDDEESPSQCINPTNMCDDAEDCRNGADEKNCTDICPSDFLRCDTRGFQHGVGNCYHNSSLCDGYPDCYDGSDEISCECTNDPVYTCSNSWDRIWDSNSSERVNYTVCVTHQDVCDGYLDCSNGVDEFNCTCESNKLACADGLGCIPHNWICDNDRDCGDGSDELNCTCAAGFTTCEDGVGCVNDYSLCDGNADCSDGSDEEDCPCFIFGLFECPSYNASHSRCIEASAVCDGVEDCLDNHDEYLCNETCPTNYTRCDSGAVQEFFTSNFTMNPGCLSDSLLCDFNDDCIDGSDELNCPCSAYGYATCNSTGKCIPQSWICDLYDDCGDNEDEEGCPCPALNMQCETYNSSSDKCVPFEAVCNGINDCTNGSDEANCDGCSESRCETGGTISPPFGACVTNSSVCDSIVDCFDHSDELFCSLNESCTSGEVLRCAKVLNSSTTLFPSYVCIANDSICDGIQDCIDGEDERCCEEYQCANGECIPFGWLCDGDNDCGEEYADDEYNCSRSTCNGYQCANGKCIPFGWLCDGDNDCGEDYLDDENNCNNTCEEYQCANGKCINSDQVCDGDNDCGEDYLDDEYNCDRPTCYQCTRGFCLDYERVCNGYNDCYEGYLEDEYNCTCNGYQCTNGKCIYPFSVCDGVNDCGEDYLDDEYNCSRPTCNGHQCANGKCINSEQVCDGFNDCGEIYLDDEYSCTCNGHQCANGKCINSEQVCNGFNDCGEVYSDDEYNCTCDEFRCSSGRCIPFGWVCDGDYDCGTNINPSSPDDEPPQCENCSFEEYECSPSDCIPSSYVCNGVNDCNTWFGNFSDELDCESNCPDEEYECSPGDCIHSSYVCDGVNDCNTWLGNFSDELDCESNCPELTCPDGHCFDYADVCNGIYDCVPDDSGLYIDEFGCPNVTSGCSVFQYSCDDKCIDPIEICDGSEHCSDGMDEKYCDPCPVGSTRCETGAVISAATALTLGLYSNEEITATLLPASCYNVSSDIVLCLTPICGDMSDVEDCDCTDIANAYEAYGFTNTTIGSLGVTGDVVCPVFFLYSPFMSCINKNSEIICDGVNDCTDGADEQNCNAVVTEWYERQTTPTGEYEWYEPSAWSSNRLYPYGREVGDDDIFDEPSAHGFCQRERLNGNIGAQFYLQRYYNIYICADGILTFNDPYRHRYPAMFKSMQWYDDVPVIAAYWAGVGDYSLNLLAEDYSQAGSKVFYQAHKWSQNMNVVTQDVMDRATEDVQNSVDAIEGFQPRWVLVVTYLNIAPNSICDSVAAIHYLYDASKEEDVNKCRENAKKTVVNHFQVVFITDGTYSFVKFNFPPDGINWAHQGINSRMPENLLALVLENPLSGVAVLGINSGDASERGVTGSKTTYLRDEFGIWTDGIDTMEIDSLPGNLMSEAEGEFLYRVDESDGEKTPEVLCQDFTLEQQVEDYTNYSMAKPCPQNYWQMIFDDSFEWLPYLYDGRWCSISIFDIAEEFEVPEFEGLYQKCCYRTDTSLIVGAPYGGHVTDLSEVEQDAYQHCCFDSDNMCTEFYKVRPSSNGDLYVGPAIWPWFGDPHIVTSDGLSYTFNGLGEFLFTQIENRVTIQARTERVILDDGGLGQATYFSAVCVKSNSLPRVQVQINKNNDLTGVENELELIVDGTKMDISLIEQDLNTTQTMDGVDTGILFKRTNASLTVLFSSGVNVATSVSNKMLTITLALPSRFMGKTIGLTGTYDGNSENDLMKLDQSGYISSDSSDSDIFDWAQTFAVSEADSIMYYTDNTDWDTYNDNSFVPIFADDVDNWVWSSQEFKLEAYQVCGNDSSCLYDVYVTGSLEIGESTKDTGELSVITNAVLHNFAPKMSGPDAIFVTVDEQFQYVASVNDSNGDEVTVTTNILSSISISDATATITATLTSADITGFEMTLSAKDPAGAASTLTPLVMICNCVNGGTCVELSAQEQQYVETNSVILDCVCPTGYAGETCDTDLDACALVASPCYPSVLCVDSPPPADDTGYTCGDCPPGYTGDGKTCSDIDECEDDGTCDSICVNSPGSYVCLCRTGYELNADGSTCDDKDECLTTPCHHSCANTDGSFVCSCDGGFILNGDKINCAPEDPCDIPSPCDDTNGLCNMVNSSNECSCKRGYNLNSDGATCDEVDECVLGTDACAQTCTNTVGGYNCSCQEGYTVGSNILDCNDINECATGEFTCHISQVCSNTAGAYECTCTSGQVFKDGQCQALVFTNPVEPVTVEPPGEARINAILMSLARMSLEEYTVEKETLLFTALAEAATSLCSKTACDFASIASEARRRKRAATTTFYKEYFARLPDYPQYDDNGDLQLAIYSLVPAAGVLSGMQLEEASQQAATSISATLGYAVINLGPAYVATTTTGKPSTEELTTHVPKSQSTIYIAVGCTVGVVLLAAVIAVVVIKTISKQGTKTVYPTTDPEYSRKFSKGEPVSPVTKGDPEQGCDSPPPVLYPAIAGSTEATTTTAPAQMDTFDDSEPPMYGKQTVDHERMSTPPRDSTTPVDAEDFAFSIDGGSEDIEQELLSNSSNNYGFNIPIIALPESDDDSFDTNKGARICVIPPTPLPPNYDPYDNYYL